MIGEKGKPEPLSTSTPSNSARRRPSEVGFEDLQSMRFSSMVPIEKSSHIHRYPSLDAIIETIHDVQHSRCLRRFSNRTGYGRWVHRRDLLVSRKGLLRDAQHDPGSRGPKASPGNQEQPHPTGSFLVEEPQHVLRNLIGLSQNRRTGLHQNIVFGQSRRFLGHIDVLNTGATGIVIINATSICACLKLD